MMNQMILKESYNPSTLAWPNLIKLIKLSEFSVEKIIQAYQGFEGEEITFIDSSKDNLDLNIKNREYLENYDVLNQSLLCLIPESNIDPTSLNDQATFVGYDVGVCGEEKTVYSSIFNEIIFGNLDELIAWKNLLNDNLLFPDKVTARKYVSCHDELSAQGKGVEDYEQLIIYGIWKLGIL